MTFKAKCFHLLLKYRHLLMGRLKADHITQETNIEQLRKESDQMAEKLVKPIEGISYVPAGYDACYAEWVRVENSDSKKILLYFHGGGFVMGNARSHRNIVSNLCKRVGYNALLFDYPLAPEHPAPAATLESAALYQWVLSQGYLPQNIVFVGDSAGAGIQLSTLLFLKDKGISLPAACVAFSPCTDMTLSGASHMSRIKKDPCTPKGANEVFTQYYVGGGNPKHPYASPLFGDLEGLPPLFIQVGDHETLLDDSVRFAEKAKEAGVSVQLEIWPEMFHCFPLLAPMFKEADEAMSHACQFIQKVL